MSKEIYLIRHGMTDNNKFKKMQGGGIDSVLNKIGKEQAKITGKYLKEYRMKPKFDLIISSPLLRAKETAEIIAKTINYDIKKIIYDDNLKESHLGNLGNNMTWEEMKNDKVFKKFTKIIENIKKNKKNKDPIELENAFLNEDLEKMIKNKFGGDDYETHQDFLNRIKKFIKSLKNIKAKKILIVAHSGSITNMLNIMFNIGNTGSRLIGDFTYGKNCHITYIKMNNNKFQMIMPPNTLHFNIYKKNYKKKL